MKFWVYVLQSISVSRYYCGYTSDLTRRLREHNDPDYKLTRTTKVWQGPWEIVWSKECQSRSEAMKLERSIKKRGISRFLEVH
jgi:putative endonuclease